MDNLVSLKQLLKDGIIAKDEYNVISKRFIKSNVDYEETWGDIINNFYDWCIGKYSITTAKGYKTCLYKFVLYMTKELDNATAMEHKFKPYTFKMVNGFLNKLSSDGIGSQAISKTKYAIMVLGKYLSNKGIEVPDISSIKISINDSVNKTTISLIQDEIIGIANIGDLRAKVCIMLCYEGALKRIELSNLKVSDFNFEKNQLFVRNNGSEIDRVCILSNGTVSVVKEYIDELYYNIGRWNNSRISKGKEPREDFGYIFQSVKMVVPSYALLQNMLKENAKNYYMSIGLTDDELLAKASKVTFESIRNSRKVYLLAQGIPINNVMQMCGDKNYMSTYRFMKLVPLLYPEKVKIK